MSLTRLKRRMADLLNFEQILEWLETDEEGKKKTYSIYCSEILYSEFKKYCRDKHPSRVMEFLMKSFIIAAKERETKSKK